MDADTPARRAAGPELDQAVCRLVFGLETMPRQPGTDAAYVVRGWYPAMPDRWTPGLPFSADTSAGWAAMRAVVAKLRELGYWFQIMAEDETMPDSIWTVTLQPPGKPSEVEDAFGDGATLPEALARATLAAVELAARGGEG